MVEFSGLLVLSRLRSVLRVSSCWERFISTRNGSVFPLPNAYAFSEKHLQDCGPGPGPAIVPLVSFMFLLNDPVKLLLHGLADVDVFTQQTFATSRLRPVRHLAVFPR